MNTYEIIVTTLFVLLALWTIRVRIQRDHWRSEAQAKSAIIKGMDAANLKLAAENGACRKKIAALEQTIVHMVNAEEIVKGGKV